MLFNNLVVIYFWRIMNILLFESVLLEFSSNTYRNVTSEWEVSSITLTNLLFDSFSFDFIFFYFLFFLKNTIGGFYCVDSVFDFLLCNSINYTFGVGLYIVQDWFFNLCCSFSYIFSLLSWRGFANIFMFEILYFQDFAIYFSYKNFIDFFYSFYCTFFFLGSSNSLLSISVVTYLEFIYSLDMLLIIFEFICIFYILASGLTLLKKFSLNSIFYDDVITFCKTSNISLTEVGIFFSLLLGFLLFDIFLCGVEDDITDVFSYFMICFIVLLFIFILLSIDIQYYYMISSISGGDLSIRILCFDLINNFLCVLRIFFCWVRYIFYDLQVEFVDFSFHYIDTFNDLTIVDLFYEDTNCIGVGLENSFNILTIFLNGINIVIIVYVDIVFYIIQLLLGFVKLFIAFFLLWLIVDLFILKAFSLSESDFFSKLRK